jgi:hypothetical protein
MGIAIYEHMPRAQPVQKRRKLYEPEYSCAYKAFYLYLGIEQQVGVKVKKSEVYEGTDAWVGTTTS